MKILGLICSLIAFSATVSFGQTNFSITSNSAGGVRLGMSVSETRKVLKGCKLKRGSDGEGVVLIDVKCAKKLVMTLYAGETKPEDPINEKAIIEFIQVWDSRFKTPNGIHPEMPIRKVETILGKVEEIVLTQTEMREFVTFRRKRSGISYRTYGGIYEFPTVVTKKYKSNSVIFSIQVSYD